MNPIQVDYAIVMSYSFSNDWLAMPHDVRRKFEESHVFPLFLKYADTIRRRSYDTDAFGTRSSDFMILETRDLKSYYYLVEELRDSPLLAKGYARIDDFMIGIDNDYKQAPDYRPAATAASLR